MATQTNEATSPFLQWALLVKLPPTKVEAAVRHAWNEAFGDIEDDGTREDVYAVARPDLRVYPGSAGYTAIASTERGRYSDAEMIAPLLAATSGAPAYLADFEDSEVTAWSPDGKTSEIAGSAHDFCAERGCPLPRPVSPIPRCVAVVVGVAPSAVAATLPARDRNRLRFEAVPLGTLVSSKDDRGSVLAIDIGEALPGTTIYDVRTGSQPGRFIAWIREGYEDVGIFDVGGPSDPKSVPDILGASTPRDILRALGVPKERLDMP